MDSENHTLPPYQKCHNGPKRNLSITCVALLDFECEPTFMTLPTFQHRHITHQEETTCHFPRIIITSGARMRNIINLTRSLVNSNGATLLSLVYGIYRKTLSLSNNFSL